MTAAAPRPDRVVMHPTSREVAQGRRPGAGQRRRGDGTRGMPTAMLRAINCGVFRARWQILWRGSRASLPSRARAIVSDKACAARNHCTEAVRRNSDAASACRQRLQASSDTVFSALGAACFSQPCCIVPSRLHTRDLNPPGAVLTHCLEVSESGSQPSLSPARFHPRSPHLPCLFGPTRH